MLAERMPPMSVSVREVAAEAGVSVGTVSNVLNRPDKVAEATVTRVQAAIDKLGFVRNDAARQLRAGRSRSIGLVVLDVRNPFFTDLARGAEERAAQDGLSLVLCNSDESVAREAAHIDLLAEQRVQGVLFSPVGDDLAAAERLQRRGTRVVLVDRGGDSDRFSSVTVDDVMGGYLAVQHLLSLGRRRIGFVGGPLRIRQVMDRLIGAERAISETPGATLEMLNAQSQSALEGRRIGDALRERRPEDRPEALFAANDLLAIGLLQGLLIAGGIRVPDDIALIGYDDIAFAASAAVPLSSIRQPSALLGHTAVEMLLREPEEGLPATPEHVVFQPELVVRDSTSVAEPAKAPVT